jgi:hypothetical protein
MTGDPKRLLGGYATDTLTEDERRELLRAAMDDQELFDALLEEEGIRELLESPGARQEVLAALEKPTGWQRVRGWFVRPATFADLVAVAATLVVAFAGYQVFLPGSPDGGRRAASRPTAAPVSPATLAHLLALPQRQAVPASVELEVDSAEAALGVRPGEVLALRVSLRAPARVLLIAEGPDGSPVQVYPAAGEPPALVEVPPAGGPAVRRVTLVAPDAPGEQRVRLVVAPMDLNLAAASPADVDRTASLLTLTDLTYEVITP